MSNSWKFNPDCIHFSKFQFYKQRQIWDDQISSLTLEACLRVTGGQSSLLVLGLPQKQVEWWKHIQINRVCNSWKSNPVSHSHCSISFISAISTSSNLLHIVPNLRRANQSFHNKHSLLQELSHPHQYWVCLKSKCGNENKCRLISYAIPENPALISWTIDSSSKFEAKFTTDTESVNK